MHRAIPEEREGDREGGSDGERRDHMGGKYPDRENGQGDSIWKEKRDRTCSSGRVNGTNDGRQGGTEKD